MIVSVRAEPPAASQSSLLCRLPHAARTYREAMHSHAGLSGVAGAGATTAAVNDRRRLGDSAHLPHAMLSLLAAGTSGYTVRACPRRAPLIRMEADAPPHRAGIGLQPILA